MVQSWKRLGWAIAITLLQVLFALCFAPKDGGISTTYRRLLNWDSDHYRAIALKGYQAPCAKMSADASRCLVPAEIKSDDIHLGIANVVFLPAYPLTTRTVSNLTGLSIDFSLLLVSQFCAVLFWFYFLLLLECIGVGSGTQAWSVLAIAAHPAAFYLIVGYTESLFLAAMLGYFYWVNRGIKSKTRAESNTGLNQILRLGAAWLLALIHGALFCWARIVGVAVAAYPVFRRKTQVSAWILFFLCLTSLLGFFAYSQYKFGNWALYFQLEETGWQNHRRWFALLNPLTYIPPVFFEDTIQSLNKLAVTFSAYLLITVGLAEVRLKNLSFKFLLQFASTWRGALFIIAFGMFYIALTGKANSNLDSMLRYTFPSYVLLVLQVVDLNVERRARGEGALFFAGFTSLAGSRGRTRVRLKLATALIFGMGFQAWCIYRFVHGHWVA